MTKDEEWNSKGRQNTADSQTFKLTDMCEKNQPENWTGQENNNPDRFETTSLKKD